MILRIESRSKTLVCKKGDDRCSICGEGQKELFFCEERLEFGSNPLYCRKCILGDFHKTRIEHIDWRITDVEYRNESLEFSKEATEEMEKNSKGGM